MLGLIGNGDYEWLNLDTVSLIGLFDSIKHGLIHISLD